MNKEKEKNIKLDVLRRAGDTLGSVIKHKYNTIQHFADTVEMSRSTISKIIHGHVQPSNEQKIKIARELNWDSRELWPEEDRK